MNRSEATFVLEKIYTDFQARFPRQALPAFSLERVVLGENGLFDSLTIAEFLLSMEETTGVDLLDVVMERSSQNALTMNDLLNHLVCKKD